MATEVPIQTGLEITPAPQAADATGNYCIPAGVNGVLIECLNTSGAAITVTLDDVNSVAPEGYEGTFTPDPQQSVPATTGKRLFRVKDVSRFKNASNGRISWTCSTATGLTYNVYEL